MKKHAVTIALLTAATLGAGASPADAKVNVDLHIGSPAPVVVVPAPAPPPPPPPEVHRRVYFESRPEFLYTPRLGFSISYGAPYDVIRLGGRYYVYDSGDWYWSRAYDGPWIFVERHRLPDRIRRYRYEEIRRYRDEEYHRRWPERRYRDEYRDRHDRRDWHDDRGPDRDHRR